MSGIGLGWVTGLRPWAGAAAAALSISAAAAAGGLPGPVAEALERHRLPADSLSVWVQDVAAEAPLVSHRPDVARHPASTIKLLTTLVALEELGPAYEWETGVYVSGPVRDGRLDGDLVLVGSGDPYLVVEQLWRLLAAVRARGLEEVAGRLVIDNTRFSVEGEPPPGAFDGKPYRAYNAPPDALLVNFNALDVVVEAREGKVRARTEPPVAGLRVRSRLTVSAGGCARRDLRLQVSHPLAARSPLDASLPALTVAGRFPRGCPRAAFPRSVLPPVRFADGVVRALWAQMGGRIEGGARGRPGSRRGGPLASPPFASARPRRPRDQQVQQQRDVPQPAPDPGGGTLRTSRDDGQGAARGRGLARTKGDRGFVPRARERSGALPQDPDIGSRAGEDSARGGTKPFPSGTRGVAPARLARRDDARAPRAPPGGGPGPAEDRPP